MVEYKHPAPAEDVPPNSPFDLIPKTGVILTTMDMEFVTEERFRLGVEAFDNPGMSTQKTITAEVIVSTALYCYMWVCVTKLFKKQNT